MHKIFQFIKKERNRTETVKQYADDQIVAVADGHIIPLEQIHDPIFSSRMLGDGIGLTVSGSRVKICAPANGILKVLFPTGYGFGVQMADGTEILVHCGIDTDTYIGNRFRILNKSQGDRVSAADPIIEVDFDVLRELYDMTVVIVIVKKSEVQYRFIQNGTVFKGENIAEKI